MKRLIVLLALIVFIMAGCVTLGPSRKIVFWAMDPSSCIRPTLMQIEKGEFDLPEKERGYPIFNSKDEAIKYMRDKLQGSQK